MRQGEMLTVSDMDRSVIKKVSKKETIVKASLLNQFFITNEYFPK